MFCHAVHYFSLCVTHGVLPFQAFFMQFKVHEVSIRVLSVFNKQNTVASNLCYVECLVTHDVSPCHFIIII